jgi:hypothetical protein
MLQFDAEAIATSIPFFVNGTEFLSLNREDDPRRMRRGREASPVRWRCGRLHCGARIKQRSASPDVRFAAHYRLQTDIGPCPKSAPESDVG